ncbi:MAG: MFS transporter [Thermomicrobiales bacterium]
MTRHTPGASPYRRNIPRFYAYTFLTQLPLWSPIWVLYFTREGMSLVQIGTLEFAAMVLLALAEAPTGIVADVWGRKVSLMIGAGMQAVAMACILTQVLSPVFLVGYLLLGLSYSFISGAGDALVYDSLQSADETGRFTHIASRYAMIAQAAGGLAAVAGGIVAARDMRACFLLTGVAAALGMAVAVTFREPPLGPEEPTHRPRFWQSLRAGAAIAAHDARVRAILLMGAIVFLYAEFVWMSLLQPYGMSVGVPVWLFGGLLLMARLCRVAGAFLAPRLAGRVPRLRLISAAAGIMAGALLGLGLAASIPALALIGVVSLAAAAVMPVLSAMLNDAIPSARRATIISLQSLVSMLGLAVVQWSFFALSDRVSAPFAAGVSGILLIVLATPVLLALRHAQPAPAGPAL